MTKMNWDRVRREDRRRRGSKPDPIRKPNKPNSNKPRRPTIDPTERLAAEAFVRSYEGPSKWMLSVQAQLFLPMRALTPAQFEVVQRIRREEANRATTGSTSEAPSSGQRRTAPLTSKPRVDGGRRSRRAPTT